MAVNESFHAFLFFPPFNLTYCYKEINKNI